MLALEAALRRQKAICKELEQLVEDKTREAYLALEGLRAQTRLVGHHAATRYLAEAGDLDSAATKILLGFCETLGWDVGILWRVDDKGDRLTCRAFVARGSERPRFEEVSRVTDFVRGVGLPGRVWADARAHWVADVVVDSNFPRAPAAAADGLHCACAFPVVMGSAVVAVIELSTEDVRAPDEDLLLVLAALGTQIGQFLEKREAEERLMANDLTVARRMQRMIAPRDLRVEGLDVAAVVRAADAFGGDLYDVFPFPGGAYFAIGDVSGHGLLAGFVMLMTQSALAAIVSGRGDASPSDVITILNRVLFETIRRRLEGDDYVTFMLLCHEVGGEISFAGGHEEILVFRHADRTIETVGVEGPWLGISGSVVGLRDRRLRLAEGDVLVLHTDGVTEARNERREQFGMERLAAVVARAHGASAEVIRDAIMNAVTQWIHRQDDDITVMVVRRTATA